jgi:CHAT domain-containing protein
MIIRQASNVKGKLSVVPVDLGRVKKIDDSIRATNETISISNIGQLALADRGIKKPGIKKKRGTTIDLETLVLKKLLPHLIDCKTLVVCPSGELSNLNWANLTIDKGRRYLIEKLEIVQHENASRVLAALQNHSKPLPGCLAIGITSGLFKGNGNSNEDLPELKEAASEARFVFDSFTEHVPHGSLLTGNEVTKARVNAELSNYGTLHIAAHGVLTSQWQKSFHQHENASIMERYPLLNSAILIKGNRNDHNAKSLSNCEFLTAYDVLENDLSSVGLVVLSACNSGSGATSSSDGVFGIEKSFRLAGAHSTLTSKQKLNDQMAKRFVVEFYKNLQSGMSKSETLQATQVSMIEKKVPAKHWATWRLTGDWR